MTQEELFLRVCDVLHHANAGPNGMRLLHAIRAAKGVQSVKPSDKNYIRDRLDRLGKDQPGSVYFLYDGKRYFPDKVEDAVGVQKGKPMTWVVLEKPLDFTPERKALVISVVEAYSSHLLPPWERRILRKLFEEESPRQQLPQWLDKTQIVPRYPPLYPNLDEHHEAKEELMLKALELDKGFIASYLKGPWYRYFPLKLVRRESVSYIVCHCHELADTREYAMHRFSLSQLNDVSHTELIDWPEDLPRKRDTSHVLDNVDGRWGLLKRLRIKVTGPPAQHLSEIRFHADESKAALTQIIDYYPQSGSRLEWVELEVQKVQYNYTFKTWLLGLGGFLTIQSVEAEDGGVDPIRDLREELKVMTRNLKCTVQ